MNSLAELPDLVGFFSYSRRDDERSEGALSRLRARIYSELGLQLGRDFRLWQDVSAIPHGALRENEIKKRNIDRRRCGVAGAPRRRPEGRKNMVRHAVRL
jgi:hypothetical protein